MCCLSCLRFCFSQIGARQQQPRWSRPPVDEEDQAGSFVAEILDGTSSSRDQGDRSPLLPGKGHGGIQMSRCSQSKPQEPPSAYIARLRATLEELLSSENVLVGAKDQHECVICLERFTQEDPEMLTLCNCG
jgi:hypothetical protein